jgi:hypothetical protein
MAQIMHLDVGESCLFQDCSMPSVKVSQNNLAPSG